MKEIYWPRLNKNEDSLETWMWRDYGAKHRNVWTERLKNKTFDNNTLTQYVIYKVQWAKAQGCLPEGLRVINGIVVSEKYLAIQERWDELESDLKGQNSAEIALRLFEKYTSDFHQARDRHSGIYYESLRGFNEDERSQVKSAHERVVDRLPPYGMVLLAQPTEEPELWRKFIKIHPKYALNVLPSYYKLHEDGLVLGSAKYRNDAVDGRGHDFLAYCGQLVRSGQAADMAEALKFAGSRHEGSHGFVDKILPDLLRMDDNNMLCEGIAVMLGEDVRDFAAGRISISDAIKLINRGKDIGSVISGVNYRWGPAWFDGVFRNFGGGVNNSDKIWVEIFGEMLRQACVFGQGREELNDSSCMYKEITIAKLQRTREFIEHMEKVDERFKVQNIPSRPYWI